MDNRRWLKLGANDKRKQATKSKGRSKGEECDDS